ncbi:fibrinogen-like protein A [Oculina patagonica]
MGGDSEGDGEYWIDPTASGDPFTVFCDMTTDRGGWTLISRFRMNDANSLNDAAVSSNSYREILTNYNYNKQYFLRNGFNQLKIDMGFTQIRFYCFKKERGRVIHIMTNKDNKGANVVTFFTDSDTIPEACGSFTLLPDDNSTLANSCGSWGSPVSNRWGHQSVLTDNERLYLRPFVWPYQIYFTLTGSVLYCDDDLNEFGMSLGDIWKIFVR